MMMLVIIGLLGVAIWWAIHTYNKFIHQIEAIRNNQKLIDVQLDRRFKVFESLIEVVKKYMDYEKSTLKEVITLRTQAQQALQAGNEKERIAAEEGISKIASSLNVIFENYPQLKANENALHLQEEIVNTENRLTYSKQAYNDSIENYNASKRSALEAIVVNLFKNKLDLTFNYWGLTEEQAKTKEAYTVKL
jgi:LemA protein